MRGALGIARIRCFAWVHAWAALIDALVAIMTFGVMWTHLAFRVAAWNEKYLIGLAKAGGGRP